MRELVPSDIIIEKLSRDGNLKVTEVEVEDALESMSTVLHIAVLFVSTSSSCDSQHTLIVNSVSEIISSSAAHTYKVSVMTGDVYGAGTDANVFLTIYGDQGDTGERKLRKSETNGNKFERGSVRKHTPLQLFLLHENT